MCKVAKNGDPAAAPNEGVPSADNVNIADNLGQRVTRSSLVSGFGFRRSSPQMLSKQTFGEALSTRFGFPSTAASG